VYEEDDRYFLLGDSSCQTCRSFVLDLLKYILVNSLAFAFMMILVFINVRKAKESKISVLIRILTNYMQLMATILSFSPELPSLLNIALFPLEKIGGASDNFIAVD
jgi:hypothetical protein